MLPFLDTVPGACPVRLPPVCARGMLAHFISFVLPGGGQPSKKKGEWKRRQSTRWFGRLQRSGGGGGGGGGWGRGRGPVWSRRSSVRQGVLAGSRARALHTASDLQSIYKLQGTFCSVSPYIRRFALTAFTFLNEPKCNTKGQNRTRSTYFSAFTASESRPHH